MLLSAYLVFFICDCIEAVFVDPLFDASSGQGGFSELCHILDIAVSFLQVIIDITAQRDQDVELPGLPARWQVGIGSAEFLHGLFHPWWERASDRGAWCEYSCILPCSPFPANTVKVGGLLLGAISICRHGNAGKQLRTWQDYF